MKKLRSILKKQGGFSLIELIVAMGLLAIALTMIYSFLQVSNNYFTKNAKRADIQAQLRVVMLGIKNTITTADNTKIYLLDDEDFVTGADITDNEFYYTTSNYLEKLHDTTTTRVLTPLELEELEIGFSLVEGREKLVRITLKSGDVEYVGDVLAANTSVWCQYSSDPAEPPVITALATGQDVDGNTVYLADFDKKFKILCLKPAQ